MSARAWYAGLALILTLVLAPPVVACGPRVPAPRPSIRSPSTEARQLTAAITSAERPTLAPTTTPTTSPPTWAPEADYTLSFFIPSTTWK